MLRVVFGTMYCPGEVAMFDTNIIGVDEQQSSRISAVHALPGCTVHIYRRRCRPKTQKSQNETNGKRILMTTAHWFGGHSDRARASHVYLAGHCVAVLRHNALILRIVVLA